MGEGMLTVYFDGGCPLCRREIDFYRRRRGARAIEWVDVSTPSNARSCAGLGAEQALERFHIRLPGGELVSGGRAFAELWAALPGFRTLGLVMRRRPLCTVLEWAYIGFLRVRPRLQRIVARRVSIERDRDMPDWLTGELRSDHAGESGAVQIYRGVLASSGDPTVRAFAQRHLETESRHLRELESALPERARSRLLPLWRLAGWLTGAVPALLGARAVYATIDAVESFVDRHYAQQIDSLTGHSELSTIRSMLERCRADELEHRDEARAAGGGNIGRIAQSWAWLVNAGSVAAVSVARRV